MVRIGMVLAVAALCATGGPASAQVRLPPVKPEAYTEPQKAAASAFEQARKGPVFGPFAMLIRSPEVMTAARQLGDHLRFDSAVGTTLSELAILVVAREWTQDYEWNVHAPIAERAGIGRQVIAAIADGRRPERMSADEALVYDFTVELNRNKRVSDATYGRALARWGEAGVVDLSAISGYYTLLAMAMNVARTDPEGPRLTRLPE